MEQVVRKLKGLPWDPFHGASKDEEETVERVVQWFFREFPETRGSDLGDLFPSFSRTSLLRAIIPPVFLAIRHCGRIYIENRLKDALEDPEIWGAVQTSPGEIRYTVHVSDSLESLDRYVKAVLLFYALSSFMRAKVIELGALFEAFSKGSSAIEEYFSHWFLVVTFPSGLYHNARFYDGDVVSFLERRRRTGRFTAFADLSASTVAASDGESLREVFKGMTGSRLARLLSDKTVLYTA